MADQEEDFSALPMPERFAHKNWKVRKEAYEEAAKILDNAQSENDPLVRELSDDPGLLKGAVADSNVAAQQEGLNALCSFLQICGIKGGIRTRHVCIAPIAEKGLVSTKPVSKQKSLEALLLYVELDKADPTLEELLPMLSHKQPKVIAATLAALTVIYHEFGVRNVDPKVVLKVLPKVYGHADKNVRAEAQNLTVELYRWLKEAMKPMFWNDLKPVQQQDLDKLFEKVSNEPPPQPLRLLRSQQAAPAPAASGALPEGVDGNDDEEAEIDLEPELLAVDVFPKIPKDFLERLGSTKWKDRKDALDDLQAAINCPAIEEGPFDDIIRGLAKCMRDANIAVVSAAANCIQLLATGLRRGFARYRSMVLTPVMERLKDKKQSVTDALAGALDAVFASTSLSDCLDDTLEFMKNKNPQIKLESSRFLIRCLQSTREAPTPEQSKAIADPATKLLSDSQETQRTAAAGILGTLWKIMGDRTMNPFLEGLDDIRKAKVKEMYEAAEVKAKHKVKSAPAAPKAGAAPMGKRPVMQKKPGPGAAGAPRPAAAAKKPTAPSPEPLAAPLQPKPTPKPGLARPGIPTAGSRGLKAPTAGLPKALAPPGSALRPTSFIPGSNPLSPRRNVPAPPNADSDDNPQPKLNRGLTGQRLTKPTAVSSEPSAPPQIAPNPLSAIERTELEELRAETERLRQYQSNLRTEHSNLTNQIHELQNQNAQLIEDHTRDVLTIKAKETQLVRARSDAETAEHNAYQLQREVDRLKRELGRMGRADRSPRSMASPDLSDAPSAYDRAPSGSMSPNGEGKENRGPYSPDKLLNRGPGDVSGISRPVRPATMFVSGTSRGTTQPLGTPGNGLSDLDKRSTMSASGRGDGATGVESWKRAAEVTQNLKARIEMMKAKQNGLSR